MATAYDRQVSELIACKFCMYFDTLNSFRVAFLFLHRALVRLFVWVLQSVLRYLNVKLTWINEHVCDI